MGGMDRFYKRKEEREGKAVSKSTGGSMDRYYQRQRYKSLDTSSVDDNYIKSFASDASSFFSGVGDNTVSYSDANSRLTDLGTRFETLQGWLYQNENKLDGDTYTSFSNMLKEFQSGFDTAKGFYSQFESEDAYQNALRIAGYQKKYDGKSYEEITSLIGELDDGEEKEWLNSNKYKYVKSSSDFDSVSSSGWKSYLADTEKASQPDPEEKWCEKIARYLGTSPDTSLPMGTTAQVANDLRNDTSYLKPSSNWDDEQKGIYGYLYGTGEKSAAGEYARYINEANNKADNEEKIAAIEEWATKNGFNGAVATLASIAMMPLSLADTLSALTEYNARGFVSTPATPMPGQISNAITSAISSTLNESSGTINENIPVIGGKGIGDVYQIGTGIANSMLTGYTQGTLGTYMVFFGSASASGMYEKKAKGATDEQALTYGILSGLAEAAGEAFSVDKLLDRVGVSELKSFFANVLMQAGIEASEEGVTTLLNNFSDQLVMGDKSNFNILVNYYMTEENLSLEEAKRKAWKSMANDLAFDMVGGAISGGVSSGIQTGVQTIIKNAAAKELYGDNVQDLVTESLEINPDNALAQKMQRKLDSGKNVSGYQINRLVEANETSMLENDVQAIQSAAENRLSQLGERGDVKAIATALTKQAQGKKLSLSERETIKSSTYGQRVANELNTENIKGGGYSSAWAEKIGTDRINPEEYSRLIAEIENGDSTVSKPEQVDTETEAPTANVHETVNDARYVDSVAETDSAGETETVPATENVPVTETAAESEISGAEDVAEDSAVTLNSASKKYGAQAGAMISTYNQGQDVEQFDAAYSAAYDMGKSGVNISYAMNSEATGYLSESQRELAYAAGADSSSVIAKTQDAANKAKANGKTGRRKGVVRGEGVTISDLKASFNDTQGTAYKILSSYAEATGIDIVLYRSEANESGDFEGAQGKFKWSEDTIYIDINAGLANIKSVNDLAKYTMLRTFSHEFTHFIEKWNPIQYNEFRKVVFDTLTERGEDVNSLIETKMSQNEGMSYDKASREVVAEAMTDILPDANFVEELATKHRNIFNKLLEKLKEFVADLKAYFNTIKQSPSSREARALKEQVGETVKYVENIVKLFDKIAVEAVENYQTTVATEENAENHAKIDSTDAINAENNADNGSEFTITDNAEYGTLEIKFDGKPSEAVRDVLKEHKFRWHKVKGVWYGKSERSDIVKALREAYKNDESDTRSSLLNADEEAAILAYKSGGSYLLNAKIREGAALDEYEQKIVSGLDSALEKLPTYKGKVYRNIQFDGFGDGEARKAFVDGHVVDGIVRYPAYTSTSKEIDGYPLDGEFVVRFEIESLNGRNVEGHGNNFESEVLFPRNARFAIDNIVYDAKGTPTIYLTEVSNEQAAVGGGEAKGNVSGDHSGESRSRTYTADISEVQSVQAQNSENSEMQPSVSERNTGRDIGGGTELQGVPAEVNADITINEAEVNPNGENVDNTGAVQHIESDRSGDTRILDEVQTADVQGDAPRGDAVGDSVERGQETGRADNRADNSERARGGSGEGDSQSSDLRRDDGLTTEESSEVASEKLHEEVTEQIAQQSTEQPKGRNFVIGDSLDLPNGEKSRYKANIEAIRLVKQLEAEGRYATEAEQAVLSKYVGWGGLANAFDQRKTEWAKEYTELKELLSDEEYASARGSTLNAHYTDISVIKAMYDGLAALGFNGGRLLEPSSGVGNFVGAMPSAMSAKVKSWTMVELDGITGLIAKYLYPNADVRIQGFEKANIPDNYMDVAISNVPFGNYAIADKKYPKRVTSAIHNYFFAKTLDKVRPGGIVMFITSAYTMNAKDDAVRRYIMQRADLLGAIRLPDSAFKGNAGTEVVTDIIVLKKRAANTEYAGEDFLEAPYKYISNYNGAYINSYFDAHPEMVLGTPTMDGGMYRGNNLTYKALEGKGSLAEQIREAFSHIKGKMEYPATLSKEKTNFAVERATKKTKENGLVVKDGKVYQNKGGELVEINKAKGAAERISSLLEIRDVARDLMNYQQRGLNESEIRTARLKLNKAYDAFVKKYGFINAQANRNAIVEDPDRYSILALENWNPDTKKATKADIFSKNTITPNRTVTSAKDVGEGLIVSVNQTGGVDTALIAKLTGKTEKDVTRELIDGRMAFKNRNGDLEAAEVYLSGNVRAKLRDAEALAPIDSDYKNNVEALKSVIPEDVGYEDIFVNPGTPWIPNSVYSDFAAYMLGSSNSEWRQSVDVTRNADTGNFTIELKNRYLKTNAFNTQKWGTSRRSFLDLFDAMLNSKSVVIKDKLDDGSFIVNKDATAAANEKIENIQKEFQEWLWRDEARRGELVTLYNETFNSIVTPKYNGDNLTVNGANALKPLRPHQRNAVQRVISSGGNTLLAHKVGAGKTYEMAAAAMKLKELGLVKKPMFVVPKSLVAQWGVEFKDFFPMSKLLVAEASDFATANRKVFMNRIANGEYDAVIVSYEQFEKLPMSDDFTRELYQEQINSVIAAIEEAKAEKGDKALSIKDLEKKRKSLQTKIDKLTDKAKDEGNIDFEQLGVDSLFVDEAHNFKNLFYTTSMTNVSGLGNKDGSKRAFDLYTKVRYLQQFNGGRGIVFATATPVMNSMSEMYIMQKYLQPDLLNQLGLSTFDAWAKQFGEVVNGVEIKPSGQGYRVKQSFSRFKNMSELQLLFRNFADVLTNIPGLKIPKMKGGKVNVVVCDPGQFQQDFMKELEKRADNIKNVDPSEDNMLKITSDGRKISYTQRMIDPSLPYEEGCKIFRCADNVVKEYNDSKSVKGTQLIFCDMATPKGKSNNNATENEEIETDSENTLLYDDIKARLVKGGIPAKEIAFIHDADTDQKKKKLFADVNDGKVRVLIGSTGKMGVGMNAQKRIVAIHHLDAPWRPGDVEQRDGRAFRQGNINDEVSKYTYVTEGSFDARLWDILDRKQTFINQVMNGESVGREAEDTGEVTLSAAEVKALASGSPLIMEQVQLDTDIKKLESLYRAHVSAVRSAKERLSRDAGDVARYEKLIANGKADATARVDTYSEGKFSITIGKQKFTDKKEAGTALMAAATAKAVDTEYTTIGNFAGFDVRVIKTHEGIKGILSGKQGYSFNTYPERTTFMITHISGVAESIDEKVKLWQHNLEETQKDIAEQEKLIAEPFAKQADLDQKRARYNEVMAILNPKEEQSLDSVAEDTVQEQSRAYLNDVDREYIDAVKNGDMETAQRMVDEAASKAMPNSLLREGKAINKGEEQEGTLIKMFHGSGAKNFNHFVSQNGALGKGVYVTSNWDEAVGYAIDKLGIEESEDGNTYVWNGEEYDGIGGIGEALETGGYVRAFYADVTNANDISSSPAYWEDVIALVHDENMLKSADPVTYDDNGNIIPLSDRFNKSDSDIRYQQRTNSLSDREVLQMAAEKLEEKGEKMSEAERDALRIFKDRLSKLYTLQEERTEQGKLYREQQFGAQVDRAAAEKTLNRMHVLDDQIKAANEDVLSIENKKVLADVLKKARGVVEAEERIHGEEILKRWRDRTKNNAAIKKYRERIKEDVNDLTSWVLKPNNKDIVKHIPDALKNTVIPFLTSIDFTSKQQLRGGEATKADAEFVKRLNALNGALKRNIDINGLYSGYNDLPPNFMEKLQSLSNLVQDLVNKKSGVFVINQMTSEELKELSGIVRILKTYVTQINKFHANAMYQHVFEAGDSTIEALSAMQSDNGRSDSVSNFVFWQQMRPAYAFERFGNGGKAIYDGLRRGQAQLAFNTQKIVEFSEKAYTDKEVKSWEKEIKTIKLGGQIVKMRVSDIMSFYELSKQPDSLRHMLGEGFRVATYTLDGKKISHNGHTLTEMDIVDIVSTLTQRQKDVADALQKFMQEQGAAWGNYVSVKRFGEELFTNEQYFPINSDGRHLQATADESPSNASLYALLNMSFTKSRNELANNRIIIYSIFDVFANHMASMAQYNAMALPVLDAIKWFNYQQKTEDSEGNKYVKDGVREQMDRVYGVPEESRPGRGNSGYAQSFVLNIIKAFNGTEAQGIPTDTIGMNATRRYNMAQIAYNFRVVAQQPLAITRAALLVDYGSIVKGLKLDPKVISQNIEEMRKYSGIAAWKSLGFYDVNISRGLTDTIKHKSSVMDKIGDVGMWGAEKADTLTWAAMWSACKEEVIKKQKLRPSDAGFYEAVTKLFEDVIYKTQVVDSILTKNEFMRSKGFFARAIGSFMSEPTTTASMVFDAVDKFNADMRRGMNRQQAWEKNKRIIGRTVYVYTVSAVVLAAVQAVADGLRDDDDYETFVEKWLEAFGGNVVDELMLINKLPILADFYDLAKEIISIFGVDTFGNPPQSVFMQWYDSLAKGVQIMYDKISGEDTSYTYYAGIFKLLQAVSGMTSLPMASATREIVTAWNNTIGAMAPSLKVKSYDPGEKNEIKYAYSDGYLTFDEAVQELIERGLVDNENEAYFTVSGWEAGDGYSRYDAVYDAVRNGGSIEEAMQDFVAHGYTEKDVYSQVAEKVGEWYKDGEVSKSQAVSMLDKYTELDSDEITKRVNRWSSKVVTGIDYNDIGDEYIAGNISEQRAKEMYMRYGGMTDEEAANKVTVLKFVKAHPETDGISYAAVSGYTEYCEPRGIDVEVFYDAWQYKSSATGKKDKKGNTIPNSAKEKVLDYIDSLGLSKKQKDSLYYAFGYAKSELNKAPWR